MLYEKIEPKSHVRYNQTHIQGRGDASVVTTTTIKWLCSFESLWYGSFHTYLCLILQSYEEDNIIHFSDEKVNTGKRGDNHLLIISQLLTGEPEFLSSFILSPNHRPLLLSHTVKFCDPHAMGHWVRGILYLSHGVSKKSQNCGSHRWN